MRCRVASYLSNVYSKLHSSRQNGVVINVYPTLSANDQSVVSDLNLAFSAQPFSLNSS